MLFCATNPSVCSQALRPVKRASQNGHVPRKTSYLAIGQQRAKATRAHQKKSGSPQGKIKDFFKSTDTAGAKPSAVLATTWLDFCARRLFHPVCTRVLAKCVCSQDLGYWHPLRCRAGLNLADGLPVERTSYAVRRDHKPSCGCFSVSDDNACGQADLRRNPDLIRKHTVGTDPAGRIQ